MKIEELRNAICFYVYDSQLLLYQIISAEYFIRISEGCNFY